MLQEMSCTGADRRSMPMALFSLRTKRCFRTSVTSPDSRQNKVSSRLRELLKKLSVLANVNVSSLYAIARLSVCLSVTFVRLTQAVQIFGNISTALDTLATH